MTGNEYRYMMGLKRLDDIHLGMLLPSTDVKRPEATTRRLVGRGWVRETQHGIGLPTYHLTSRGLRAVCREAGRRARNLCREGAER